MGIKHLEIISDYMKKNKDEYFSVNMLRKKLNIHYGTILDCLEYLYSIDLVDRQMIDKYDGVLKYKWKGEEK